jgi:hypothetical protein
MTEKRPLKFGLLKGKVTVRQDFDSPMTLVDFLGEDPEMTSNSSEQAARAETEKLHGPDGAQHRDPE